MELASTVQPVPNTIPVERQVHLQKSCSTCVGKPKFQPMRCKSEKLAVGMVTTMLTAVLLLYSGSKKLESTYLPRPAYCCCSAADLRRCRICE